ncbi:MAG: segregation and condensation protein B [Hyphomicrobiaceae bacterium]|jgi:segregation and condensation protein B
MSNEESHESDLDDQEEGGGSWPVDRIEPVLEALLFAAGDPIAVSKLAEIVEGATRGEVRAGLKHLANGYLTRGFRLIEVAGGWQMRTGPEHHRYVRKLFRERPFRLTRAATETMAVVAYKQPCTRVDVESVRGVESGAVMETLVERNLLKIIGRKDAPGRPLLYSSTTEFLELFGLKSLRDLPTLGELGDDIELLAERGEFREGAAVAAADVLPLESGEPAAPAAPHDTVGREAQPAPEAGPEPAPEVGDEPATEASAAVVGEPAAPDTDVR